MTFFERGLVLTLLILTVNATLLMAMPQIGVRLDSTDLFSWAHSEIVAKGEVAIEAGIDNSSEFSTGPSLSKSSIKAEGTDSSVTDIPLGIGFVPFIGQVWTLVNFLLFGFLFTMSAVNAPFAIQFILGIFLGGIEVMTLFYLGLQALSAIAGVFR